MKKRKSYKSS